MNSTMLGNDMAFPADPIWTPNNTIQVGLTKREYFAGIAMHAEFLSCGMNARAAMNLASEAALEGQQVEERIAVNALAITDALLAELAKPESVTQVAQAPAV